MYLSEKNAIIPGVLAIRSFILSEVNKIFPKLFLCIVISYISGSKQNDRLVFAAELTPICDFLIKTSFICEGSNLFTGFDPFTANKTLGFSSKTPAPSINRKRQSKLPWC
jgi:hypothetical protein